LFLCCFEQVHIATLRLHAYGSLSRCVHEPMGIIIVKSRSSHGVRRARGRNACGRVRRNNGRARNRVPGGARGSLTDSANECTTIARRATSEESPGLNSLHHLRQMIAMCPAGGEICRKISNKHIAQGSRPLLESEARDFERLDCPVAP
jgi:hypothetical protein